MPTIPVASPLAILTLLLAPLAGEHAPGSMPWAATTAERTLYLMGTRFHAEVQARTEAQAQAALEGAVREIEAWEALLSTWDPGTPMSRLNAARPGQAQETVPGLQAVLREAERWARRTGRTFDPTVGPLLDAWDLRGPGRRPAAPELADALAQTGEGSFELDADANRATRVLPRAWIDTGGFGKGAALRAAAATLRSSGAGRALLDLGGQVLAWSAPDEAPWPVAVAHPTERDVPAAWLRVGSGVSVATSGTSERGVTVGGERLGHILDPRTGIPVPAWGSVTVVSADALEADVLATALYVMGPAAGLAWAEVECPDVGILFLMNTAQGVQTLHNQAMLRWLDPPPGETALPSNSTPQRRLP